jgi:acetyl esterase/lipase
MRSSFSFGKVLTAVTIALVVSPAVALASPSPPADPVYSSKRTAKMRLSWLVPANRTDADIQLVPNISYANNGSSKQTLDLFLPDRGDTAAPVIVWIHGGAWRGGDKQWGPFRSLTRHGYAVASINYRLSKQAAFPAQLHDCKAAIAWIREHALEYGLDPERIGAWGASAGGHLAALLGTTDGVEHLDPKGSTVSPETSTRVQAVVDWYGPADLSDGKGASFLAVRAVKRLLGKNPTRRKALEASPVHYVSPDDAPFLIMHGNRDRKVPVHQSQKLFRALCDQGVQAKLLIAEGEGHGLDNSHHDEVLKFFDKYLK